MLNNTNAIVDTAHADNVHQSDDSRKIGCIDVVASDQTQGLEIAKKCALGNERAVEFIAQPVIQIIDG